MAQRSVWLLDERLRALCTEWLKQCWSAGLDPLITCTYRSPEEQDELYALGRTAPGKKVTNLRGGQSKHNAKNGDVPAALAFDFVPMRNGKCVWGVTQPEDKAIWEKYITIAENLGLVCGARWKSLRDWPHLELPEQEKDV